MITKEILDEIAKDKQIILEEHEVKNNKGKVIGIRRIWTSKKLIEESLKDENVSTKEQKEQILRDGGHSDASIQKIKDNNLI